MVLEDLKSVEWDNAVGAIEVCYELGWTDGLPVVPPIVERVQQFIDYSVSYTHLTLPTKA